MALKSGHWACIAFAVVAIFIIAHAKLGYSNSAQVNIGNSLIDATITSAAFA